MTPPTHNSSQRRLGFKRRSMWYALVKDLSASYYSLVILAQKNTYCQEEAAAVLFHSFEPLCERQILASKKCGGGGRVEGICRVYWEEEEPEKI